MAVLGRLLVSSAERLDLPDLLSLDSYAAGDWKYFLKGIVGSDKPYILKGFDLIDPSNAIGTQSCSIRVADSVVFYPGSNSGSFFHGLEEGNSNAAPLVPELRKNAINYVYLTFSTFNTSVDTRAFWDPDKDGGAGGEFTQDINTESVLKVEVNVSTGSFPANTIPVAKITVGPVVITAIEDARDLMFRLGSGGINPNPFNTYGWRSTPSSQYARQEPPTQMLAGGVNPFQGADKNILTLKEWMDAVMSKLRELGGTTYWYDDTSSFNVITNFYDAVATAFKSKGKWIHDTATPGLLTWTEDLQIKMASDPRTYIIRQGSKTLADEQVMWFASQRNLALNATDENVQWINGQPYVNTIGGAVGLFANLSKGDYIKKANDTIDKWVRVEEFYDAVNLGGSTTTAAGARSVRLGSAYLGGTGSEKGRYDKGVYLPADIQVTDRNVAAIGLAGGNFHWLALRSDTIENVGNAETTSLSVAIDQHDGTTARVTSTAHGLVDGDRVTIDGTIEFNGTFQVEVETADIFYINVAGGPFADETGDAYYAIITTAARSTPYGFQEESSNHGFNSNDTVTIDGTTEYNDQYLINVRDNTTFQIAMPGPASTETAGTATLAVVIVRNEGGSSEIVQGEVIDIGGSAVDNIRQYIGMQSLSETAPSYTVPGSYNTLDGMANYNGVINENLTIRIAKLTAMMADKAQDKTIKFLPSNGITTITNTANGSAQELRFLPDGASLTIVTPSSDGQTFVALPGTATPLSLLQNQAAYVQIDRNNPSTVTMSVASIDAVPLEENTFVIAVRINTPDIYIWDGSIITVGSQPSPAFLSTVVRQNQMIKLVAGGNWSWASVTPSTPGSIQQLASSGGNTFTNAFIAGQTITPAANLTINSVAILLSSPGVVTGNMTMELWGTTAGAPNSSSVLAVSNPVSVAALNNTPTATTFTFPTPYATTSGTVYALVAKFVGTTGNITIGVDGSGGSYAGGNAYFANTPGTTGTWSNNGNDWRFDVQGTIPSGGPAQLTLAWSAAAVMQVPGLSNAVNLIPAGSVVLASGEVAYVDINRVGPGGSLTVQVAANNTLPLATDRFIIAREAGGDVIVGNHSMRLIVGESKKLYAGTSIQNLAFIGAVSEADAAPNYTSNNYVTDGQSLVASISALDAASGAIAGSIRWKEPVANFAALPVTGNLEGDVRLILDQRVAYTWDATAAAWRETGFWKTPVVNSAALPTVGNKDGDIRVTLDTGLPYYWIASLTTWRPLNGGSNSPKILGGGTWSNVIASGAPAVINYLVNNDSMGGRLNFEVGYGHGQTLIATASGNLNRVNLLVAKDIGNAGTARMVVYSIPSNAPTGTVGTLIGYSNPFNWGAVSDFPTPSNLNITLDVPAPVVSGQAYYIGIESLTQTGGPGSLAIYGNTSGTYANGSGYQRGTSGNWLAFGGDRYFEIEIATTPAATITFTADAFVERPGLAPADNTIPVSNSPIVLPSVDHVAYISQINYNAGGPALTVAVGLPNTLTPNNIIIARRDADSVIVGSSSMRLLSGESKRLYAGVSDQLLSVIPAANNADNTGIARLLASPIANTSVRITSSGKIVPDGTTYGLQLKNLLMQFTGANINFATGVITAADGVTALGINFTPATVANTQYRWYSVTLVPNIVNADNTITGQLVVIPATADGASAAVAPKAAFASTGIKLGQVVVQGNGAGINVIAQTAIIQMGTGGGGAGGTGDANELLERLKERFVEAPFEWLTANIFSSDAQAKVASATASFDVANSLYKFTAAGQNIVSTQHLDPEFLTEARDVTSVELISYWNPGFIDTLATYEVSRNGGVNWVPMTMARVGTTTDTYRGILTFPVDTSWSTLSTWAVANATAYRELNLTALQGIAQPWIITSGEQAVQQAVLYINKVGTPLGSTIVQIVKDDGAGKPSLSALDIIAQVQTLNSALASGDNAITLDLGTNTLVAGTYHMVIATDATYKANFTAGVNSVRARVDGTAPLAPLTINELNAGVWTANIAQSLIYAINGRVEDLRVRITSGAANVQMLGYGIFYGRQDNVINGIKNREVQSFNGTTDNLNTFTVTNFLPDPDLVRVFHVETGQVYMPGAFLLNGTQFIFPANTFAGLGTVTLVFDQTLGGSYDNSDTNAALMAANFLGSTNASIDRSSAGRGIFLRRPDGTLREITIDNSDNIAVYSV